MAADAPKLRQLAAGFVATWRQLLGDSGVLLLLVAAPVLYAFFYPWPYAHQAVTRVPVAVVASPVGSDSAPPPTTEKRLPAVSVCCARATGETARVPNRARERTDFMEVPPCNRLHAREAGDCTVPFAY